MGEPNVVRFRQPLGVHATVEVVLTTTHPVRPDELALIAELTAVVEAHMRVLPTEEPTDG